MSNEGVLRNKMLTTMEPKRPCNAQAPDQPNVGSRRKRNPIAPWPDTEAMHVHQPSDTSPEHRAHEDFKCLSPHNACTIGELKYQSK